MVIKKSLMEVSMNNSQLAYQTITKLFEQYFKSISTYHYINYFNIVKKSGHLDKDADYFEFVRQLKKELSKKSE